MHKEILLFWENNSTGLIFFHRKGLGSVGGSLVQLNVTSLAATTLLNSFNGLEFNSPNDIIYSPVHQGFLFTDPPYGADQGFRDAPPQLPPSVYYYNNNTGQVIALITNMVKPNGLAHPSISPWTLRLNSFFNSFFKKQFQKQFWALHIENISTWVLCVGGKNIHWRYFRSFQIICTEMFIFWYWKVFLILIRWIYGGGNDLFCESFVRHTCKGSINILCETRWEVGVAQNLPLQIKKRAWPIKNLTMGWG